MDSFKFPSKNDFVLAAKAVHGNCDFDEGVCDGDGDVSPSIRIMFPQTLVTVLIGTF